MKGSKEWLCERQVPWPHAGSIAVLSWPNAMFAAVSRVTFTHTTCRTGLVEFGMAVLPCRVKFAVQVQCTDVLYAGQGDHVQVFSSPRVCLYNPMISVANLDWLSHTPFSSLAYGALSRDDDEGIWLAFLCDKCHNATHRFIQSTRVDGTTLIFAPLKSGNVSRWCLKCKRVANYGPTGAPLRNATLCGKHKQTVCPIADFPRDLPTPTVSPAARMLNVS